MCFFYAPILCQLIFDIEQITTLISINHSHFILGNICLIRGLIQQTRTRTYKALGLAPRKHEPRTARPSTDATEPREGLPKIPHPTFTALLFTTSNRWDPPSAPPWTTGWLEGRGKGGTPGWSAVPPSEGNPATGTTVSSETSVTKGQTLCDCTQGRAEPGPIHGHRELKGAARGQGRGAWELVLPGHGASVLRDQEAPRLAVWLHECTSPTLSWTRQHGGRGKTSCFVYLTRTYMHLNLAELKNSSLCHLDPKENRSAVRKCGGD